MASEGPGRAPKGICGEKAISPVSSLRPVIPAQPLPPLAWPLSPDHFSAHLQLT